jgi:2-polyprenyl-3-methyl-5-hydroxy-6-metoxy-1,4-benzoquinol methylase
MIEAEDAECISCRRRYRVLNGIPRFVSTANYADSFGMQWNLHRKTQLDSFSGLPISRDRLFRVSGWSEDLNGQIILEAGSGAGRFTEVLISTGAKVISFDLSNAVEANKANNGSSGNLLLLQASIFEIPVQFEAFDKVICLGVLQHTPDPAAAFRSLARHVRPGGELVIDVYSGAFSARLSWKYLLRPITKRLPDKSLYKFVVWCVPKLVPLSRYLTRRFGRWGARLLPIVQYSHLGLPDDLNQDWAVLDTFDMYSPAHDHPQTIRAVRCWFEDAGFKNVRVDYGPNGVIGRGIRGS